MTSTSSDPLLEFYCDVDRLAARLAGLHGANLLCRRGCHACCSDDLSVFEVEAQFIRLHGAGIAPGNEPHPPGACAFLDESGACRIYAFRPYVCRTQGLPLRWFDESETGELVEYRDVCPLNDGGEPLEQMAPDRLWLIGPFEARLASLQRAHGNGRLERVGLRSLAMDLLR